jgi:glucosamine--fructose-6-phosphate aminotransferase (isomerizing)
LVATEQPSLYVMIARTGDVSDAVRAMTVLREGGVGLCVAVIGEEGGPLAALAHRAYEVRVSERSVVTTKTITSILLTLQIAAWRAMRHPDLPQTTRLPEAVARLLPVFDAVASEEGPRPWEEIVVLGSGPFHGLAEAGALAIREASLSQAVAHHALVYPHGHKVTLTERTLVILFGSDSARREERRVLSEVRAIGGRSVAVGERAAEYEADVSVELASGLNEWQRLVLCLPFAQLFGYRRALAKGLDPDRPRHLPKTF